MSNCTCMFGSAHVYIPCPKRLAFVTSGSGHVSLYTAREPVSCSKATSFLLLSGCWTGLLTNSRGKVYTSSCGLSLDMSYSVLH